MSKTNDSTARRRKSKSDPLAEFLTHAHLIMIADDAMHGADLRKGECYIYTRTTTAQPGDIVVVKTPAGTFVRYYHPQPDGTIKLCSTKYPALRYPAAQIEVWGVIYDSPAVTQSAPQPKLIRVLS